MQRDLTLVALAGSAPLVGSNSPLLFFFNADYDSEQRAFCVPSGDKVSVWVVIGSTDDPPERLEIVQLNILSWPAPGKKEQLFSSCFQENPDTPDAAILAAGRAEFEPFEPFVLAGQLQGHRYPESQEPLCPPERMRFCRMSRPRFLLLTKPGIFTFYVSLTARVKTAAGFSFLQTFVTDPEMNVVGSYPPDDPPPVKGSAMR